MAQIGVTKCTIQYWETNRVVPALRFRPGIVRFLGCEAFGGATPKSMAERLRAQRERLGLSRKKLAAFLRTDPSNIAGWETGRHRPTKRSSPLSLESSPRPGILLKELFKRLILCSSIESRASLYTTRTTMKTMTPPNSRSELSLVRRSSVGQQSRYAD